MLFYIGGNERMKTFKNFCLTFCAGLIVMSASIKEGSKDDKN
jgi:hypothetical protein